MRPAYSVIGVFGGLGYAPGFSHVICISAVAPATPKCDAIPAILGHLAPNWDWGEPYMPLSR